MRLGRDQRHGRRAGVGSQIVDLEQLPLADRERAYGGIEPGLVDGDALLGLEPLTIHVDQADQRDRHAADVLHQRDDPVELAIGGRVQDVVPVQGGKTIGFVAVGQATGQLVIDGHD